MVCPVCGGALEKGVLEGQRFLLWAKQPHRLTYHPKEGEILLGERTFSTLRVEANLCRTCKKITIDYGGLEGVTEG